MVVVGGGRAKRKATKLEDFVASEDENEEDEKEQKKIKLEGLVVDEDAGEVGDENGVGLAL